MSVTMYSTPWCPFCVRARSLLKQKGVSFEDIDVSRDPGRKREMMERSGQRTVPQIWIGEQHIGGCDELFVLESQGSLDALLENTP